MGDNNAFVKAYDYQARKSLIKKAVIFNLIAGIAIVTAIAFAFSGCAITSPISRGAAVGVGGGPFCTAVDNNDIKDPDGNGVVAIFGFLAHWGLAGVLLAINPVIGGIYLGSAMVYGAGRTYVVEHKPQ